MKYIEMEFTGEEWGVVTFGVNESDLAHFNCDTYEDLLAKIKAGDINPWNLQETSFVVHNSEITEAFPEEARLV